MTTYANFEAQKTTGGWFKITDTQLNIPSAMWTSSKYSHEKNKIYVPLSPIGGDKPGAKIHVLLQVDDAATKKVVEEISVFDKNSAPESQVVAYVLKDRAKFYPTRSVEGMVQLGINDLQGNNDLQRDTRKKIAALNSDLAPDFVVIEENSRPNLGMSLLSFFGGLLLTLFSLAGFLGGKSDDEPATSTEGGPASPTSGPAPPPMSGGNAG